MPLHKGSSEKVIGENIREMQNAGHPHNQAVAAALHNADKYKLGGVVPGDQIGAAVRAARKPLAGGGPSDDTEPDDTAIGAAIMASRKPIASKPDAAAKPAAPAKAPELPQLNFMGGLINSVVPGRTDRLNVHVPSDTYILPADVVSALGEGNTFAGARVLDKVFSGKPIGPEAKPYAKELENISATGKVFPKVNPKLPHLDAPPEGGQPNEFAKGGMAKMVPVVVAGGEYAVPPRVVQELGGGDVEEGHAKLDKAVRAIRARLVEVSKKLPGPQK